MTKATALARVMKNKEEKKDRRIIHGGVKHTPIWDEYTSSESEDDEVEHNKHLSEANILTKGRHSRMVEYMASPKPGTSVPYKSHFGPDVHDSALSALTDVDRFMLSKYFPGQISTPFVSGMTKYPIPTGLFSSSFSLNSCARAFAPDATQAALGTDPYLLLAYCPSLTMSVGSGLANAHGTTTHLSGLLAIQGTLTDAALYRDAFDRTNRSPSLFSLLGTNFDTYAQNGILFSSALEMKILCAAANLVGARYSGCVTLASIPNTGLSFARLIQLSQETYTQSQLVNLRGSLVNNNLVTTALTPNVNDSFGDFSNEMVHYVILQTPVISINTGLSSTYSMIGTAMGNYAWWPTSSDAFANKLGSAPPTPYNDNRPSVLSNHAVNPMLDVSNWWDKLKDSPVQTLTSLASKLLPLSGLAGLASSPFLSLLKASTARNNAAISHIEKVWLLRTLNELIQDLSQPTLDILRLPFQACLDRINEYYDFVLNYPDPLIPVDIFQPPLNPSP